MIKTSDAPLSEPAGGLNKRAGATFSGLWAKTGRLLHNEWFLLSLCLGLFLAVRLRWIGHLLMFDEAADLCSVRSFYARAHDAYSYWFWGHPPLFSLFMLLLDPLRAGFAERSELLAVSFCALNLGLLHLLNRRVFGRGTALWTSLVLALMPGSAFFDVWIKRDHPVPTFALLALLLLTYRRVAYAALLLGLALLTKETAVFYLAAALLFWLLGGLGKRRASDAAVLIVIPALTCGWWYILASVQSGFSNLPLFGTLREHMHFAVANVGYAKPWNYYLRQLPCLLAPSGVLLAALGLGLSAKRFLADRNDSELRIARLWPVLAILPAYAGLSLLPSKVPWIFIVLLPAWATLQGVGLAAAFEWLAKTTHKSLLPHVAGLAVIAGLGLQAMRMDYIRIFDQVDAGHRHAAASSREIAELMNRSVQPGDRVLMTWFHFWENDTTEYACPVFTYYFTGDASFLLKSCSTPFEELYRDILKYRIDWALLSPRPGPDELAIFPPFVEKLGLEPQRASRAVLFNTRKLLPGAVGQAPASKTPYAAP